MNGVPCRVRTCDLLIKSQSENEENQGSRIDPSQKNPDVSGKVPHAAEGTTPSGQASPATKFETGRKLLEDYRMTGNTGPQSVARDALIDWLLKEAESGFLLDRVPAALKPFAAFASDADPAGPEQRINYADCYRAARIYQETP